ncbi:MAG: hypothetical protein IMY74_00080 [Bacteroidetes bacterium]|nr:hypothetical protein [Bacteroidota bacterium]MCK5764507.1 hypothetical protein [Bacteroidales bacterium]
MSARKKYTFLYRIYRRMRYLRYVKRLRREELRSADRNSRAVVTESKSIAKEHHRKERIAEKHKRRQENLDRKEIKDSLKVDYLQDLLDNKEHYESLQQERDAIAARDRKFKRHRRRRLLRFYLKICSRNVILSLKNLNPAKLPQLIRYIRSNKGQIREFAVISIHSTLLFVAAYLLIFLIILFTSSISGVFFDYRSIIYYYEVLWLVKPEQWFGDSVKMIYASGPILAGVLALFFAIIFSYIRTERGLGKLFLLWLLIHGFNAFFGSLLIGSLFGRGFGYAIIWSFISDTEKVIYTIVSITALILLGVFTARSFLISANSYYRHLEKHQQKRFLWAQAIIPFFAGNAIIALLMLPELLSYDITVSLSLVLTIIPVAIGHRFAHSLYFEEEIIRVKFNLKVIAFPLIFIILYRVILGFGIMIG